MVRQKERHQALPIEASSRAQPSGAVPGHAVVDQLRGGDELRRRKRDAERGGARCEQNQAGAGHARGHQSERENYGGEEDRKGGFGESAQYGHAERRAQAGQPGGAQAVAQFQDRQPDQRQPDGGHHGVDVLDAGREVTAGFQNNRARPGGGGRQAEFAQQMPGRNARDPELQNYRPLDQHRQALGREKAAEEGGEQNQRMKKAGVDVGEDRVAAVVVRVPESELVLAELAGEEGEQGKLHAAKIPREQVRRIEQGLMEEDDSIGEEAQIRKSGGTALFHSGGRALDGEIMRS